MIGEDAPTVEELLAEMTTQCAALQLENETLTRIFRDAPTGIGGAVDGLTAEVKKQCREIVILRERNDGLLDEKNSAIRAAAAAEKRARKAEAA